MRQASKYVSCLGLVLALGCATADNDPHHSANAEGALDTCKLVTLSELAEAVGNPVAAGKHYAGSQVCEWKTGQRYHVSVLLTVRPKGSLQEPSLCKAIWEASGGVSADDEGQVATWRFDRTEFSTSGALEVCSPAGYVSVSLSGERDEDALRQGAVAVAGTVINRLPALVSEG